MTQATPVCATDRSGQPDVALKRLARQARCWGSCLLLGVGLWLLVRRFGGALAQPLDATQLIAAAVWLSVLSGGLRWGGRAVRRPQHRPTRMDHIASGTAAAGLFACGMALSLPGSPPGAVVGFWCLVLTLEAAWFAAERARAGFRRPQATVESDTAHEALSGQIAASPTSGPPPIPWETSAAEGESGELLPPGGSQRISRSQDAAGSEVVSGLVRCAFAPDERHRDVHLSFCPPLKRIPQFSAEQVEGPPARIRTVLVETFGVGLEVRLAALSSEPTCVQIQFFACEEPVAEEIG